jgi:hypothetical protein
VPVIAPPRGSVPEVVVHGRTGWIASTVDEMAEAVRRCDDIDPRECRAIAERRFSPQRMVRDYVRALESVIERRTGLPTGAAAALSRGSLTQVRASRVLPRQGVPRTSS